MSSNIFFKEYETPYHTIPFDKIKTSDYKPAFLEGFKQHLEEIDKIVKNTEYYIFIQLLKKIKKALLKK